MNITLPNPRCAGPLLTELYQLTMAYGYWKSGKADQGAVFELFFRTSPFQCGFINPHQYPVGLESGLHELKTELILQARGEAQP